MREYFESGAAQLLLHAVEQQFVVEQCVVERPSSASGLCVRIFAPTLREPYYATHLTFCDRGHRNFVFPRGCNI